MIVAADILAGHAGSGGAEEAMPGLLCDWFGGGEAFVPTALISAFLMALAVLLDSRQNQWLRIVMCSLRRRGVSEPCCVTFVTVGVCPIIDRVI